MQFKLIQRVVGLLLALFSGLMIPPAAVGIYYRDSGMWVFSLCFTIILFAGLMIWWPVRSVRGSLRLRDGYIVVTAFWTVLGVFGCLPLLLEPQLELNLAQAIFESISALTTTGATVIVGLDVLPKSILFYRQWVQWFGGMGIIVLAVAVLPLLGIGGMQLYRAETPGPQKDSKFTPRIAETAKMLWLVYVLITIVCGVAYYLAGMELFDAIGHAFSTVAAGGFSPYDASIGYFDNAKIEIVAMVFMAIAGFNFSLHFFSFRHLNLKNYWRDEEARTYISLVFLVGFIATIYLFFAKNLNFLDSMMAGYFQTISFLTTTGFATDDYSNWPGFLPMLLLFISFIGGCSGSTGGGMKVLRVLLLFKQGMREITRMLHPQARVQVKIGGQPLPDRVSEAVWGFFAAYVGVFIILLLALIAFEMDPFTAFSAVSACLNNLGPGLGSVGANYSTVNEGGLMVLSTAMLLGRLEIFTLLVLFTPMFWRH